MAVFELQGPDGVTYEVDAPNEAAALNAFKGMQGGGTQPVGDSAATPPGVMGYLGQIGAGLTEGATNMLGAPVDMMNSMVVGPALKGINALAGTNLQPSQNPIGGAAGLREGLHILPPSADSGQQFARRAAQSVGAGAIPAAAGANTARQLMMGLIPTSVGGVAAAGAQQAFPGNPYAEIAAELVGSLGTAGAMTAGANRSARIAAERAVPSVQELKTQASSLYDRAESRGVVADPTVTTKIGQGVKDIARTEQLITPRGNVLPSYPRSGDALKLVDEYSGLPMSAKQVQNVRESLADHAFVAEGKDRTIARKMLTAFDKETTALAPELAQARSTYQRAMKGQELEKMRELGEVRASQFSASGPENAMRTEYRALDRNIVKGNEPGWSPAETQAIQNVDRGTPAQNFARMIGKAAPTGIVSAGLGGGVPFMIGSSIGGPAAGVMSSVGTMGAGAIGRAAANAIQRRNIEIAELLARNGGTMPAMQNPAINQAIMRALLGEYAAMPGQEVQ